MTQFYYHRSLKLEITGKEMRYLSLLLACCIAAGCASSWKSMSGTRVSADLTARQYNSVAADYRARPTFVSLRENMGGEHVLVIAMDSYGSREIEIYIPPAAAPEVMGYIQKYKEWEALAVERGDMLTKDIGEVPNFTGFRLRAKFHSGNETTHYLALEQCVWPCSLSSGEETQVYDKRGVEQLEALLNKYMAGELVPLDADSVYK